MTRIAALPAILFLLPNLALAEEPSARCAGPACNQLAASDSQCNAYADQAINQQAANIDCGQQLKGVRWHNNRDDHHKWCRAMPLETVNQHARLRAAELASCERKRSTCNAYAHKAVDQNRSMHILRCGYSGTRWSSNWGDHRHWCMKASGDQIQGEQTARTGMLGRCRSARR